MQGASEERETAVIDDEDDDCEYTPGRPPFFEPELVGAGPDRGRAIAIRRRHKGVNGGLVADGTVATLRFNTRQEAVDRLDWMNTRPERWEVWGRMAPILGVDTLATFIAAEQAKEDAERAEQAARREEEERRASTVRMACEDDRSKVLITLKRGDDAAPVIRMALSSKAERDRIWDWLRWQTGRYRDWHALCAAKGPQAVEREILEGMLRDEARLRKAGLSAGGRRPLRFWRGDEEDAG